MNICKCGCGKECKSKYIRGHNSAGRHCKFSKQAKINIGLAGKGRIPWNKDKTNVYSKEALDNMSKIKIGKKRPDLGGDKSPTKRPEVRNKIGESYKKTYWSNRDDILSRRLGTLRKNDKPQRMFNTKPELQFEAKIKDKLNFIKQEYICGCPIDFYIAELKLCIFIDGDYWHCNPKKYSADYFHKLLNKTAAEIWVKDKYVTENLISNGYKVLRIWQCDIDSIKIEEQLKQILSEVK